MVVFALIIAALVISAAALAFLSIGGIPVAVVMLAIVAVAVVRSSRKDGGPITVERTKPMEPSGRTRPPASGAGTANRRTGQV
jgi:hypothetical protein